LTMVPGALGALKLLSILLLTSSAQSCNTEADCSLLGECVNGGCLCDPGWKGERCGQVDLLPADRYKGYRNDSMSSWGGHSIKIGDTWHMFASAMSHKCPLKNFATNSMSIHATSKSPEGPYQFEDIPLPEFHHSTTIMRVNETTLALFTIGKTTHGQNVHDCETNSSNVADDHNVGDLGPHDHMSVSLSNSGPDGPWEERFIYHTNLSDLGAWNCNWSNPSPLLFENGTVLMMYRGETCPKDPGCKNDTIDVCNSQGIAIADSIDGPFRDRQGQISELTGNEDAVFFRTKRGFAAMFHSKNACGRDPEGYLSCGSLAYSKDTWNWSMNSEPSYNHTVQWREPNGSVTEDMFLSRQRPKLIFAEDGITPLYLTNGVLASGIGGGGMEFTVAIPFNVPQNRPH